MKADDNKRGAHRKFNALVRKGIEDADSPADAAFNIKTLLEEIDVRFDGQTDFVWLTMLCRKWHDKTPDLDEQATQIARRIRQCIIPANVSDEPQERGMNK